MWRLSALLLVLLVPTVGIAGPATSSYSINVGVAPNYVGPGDIYQHQVWYGVRAYSSATRGQKLMNVCDTEPVTWGTRTPPANTDIACADMFSDINTGDVVPATIGNTTCPNTLGTCTIKIAYDLTGNGVDVVQNTPNQRYMLMSKAIPILGVNRACMWAPDYMSSMVSTTNINWSSPLTMSAFMTNTSPGLGRVGNTPSGSIVLRPPSNAPRLFFAFPTASSSDDLRISAGVSMGVTVADAAPIVDHAPHAVQAMFSVNGKSSSAYVDGVAYTGLTTGPIVPVTAPVELGAASAANVHFNGVICEAGLALGDQSASNAAVDVNQSAYYTIPTVTYVPVFDWKVDFNNLTPGSRFDWPTQKATFNDPSLLKIANGNYVVTATNAPCTYTGTQACIPAPTVELSIAGDGPDGTPALQGRMITGSCGYGENGAGNPDLSFSFQPSVIFNVIDVEYDVMFRAANTAPNGLDFDWHSEGKTGVYVGFTNPFAGGNLLAEQAMWYATKAGINGPTAASSMLDDQDGFVENQNIGYAGPGSAMGQLVRGVWYHRHHQVALGPNGWLKTWADSGPGTPVALRHAYSRSSPWRSNGSGGFLGGMTTAQNPLSVYGRQFALEPHFGGQPPGDCAQNDSYLVWDNIHVKAYMRQ